MLLAFYVWLQCYTWKGATVTNASTAHVLNRSKRGLGVALDRVGCYVCFTKGICFHPPYFECCVRYFWKYWAGREARQLYELIHSCQIDLWRVT